MSKKNNNFNVMGSLSEKDLKEYSSFFESNKLEKFELLENGVTVSLERAVVPMVNVGAPMAVVQSQGGQEELAEETKEIEVVVPVEEQITIDSPITGTFYHAASPEAPPFVKAGQTVSSDEVVCIVEAMKVMNEIKAGKSGKVSKVLVKNGDLLTTGQPIFTLE